MEYDFTRDKEGRLTAELSMGHEAFGHWLNSEGHSEQQLADIEQLVQRLQSGQLREQQLIGKEYSLQLTQDEAEIHANHQFYQDDFQDDELNELSQDDEQSFAACGLDDFAALLSEWREFVSRHRSR